LRLDLRAALQSLYRQRQKGCTEESCCEKGPCQEEETRCQEEETRCQEEETRCQEEETRCQEEETRCQEAQEIGKPRRVYYQRSSALKKEAPITNGGLLFLHPGSSAAG
jgi:hypothetical protein